MDESSTRYHRCPVCNGPVRAEAGEIVLPYESMSLLIDPCVFLRAAEALHIVAQSIAGGTSTTMPVAQMVTDEKELRQLAKRLQG